MQPAKTTKQPPAQPKVNMPFKGGRFRYTNPDGCVTTHDIAGVRGMTRIALTGHVSKVQSLVPGRKRKPAVKVERVIHQGVFIPRGKYDGPLLRAIRAMGQSRECARRLGVSK